MDTANDQNTLIIVIKLLLFNYFFDTINVRALNIKKCNAVVHL